MAARVGAIHHQLSPARNSSEQPSIRMISVVPRLGCSTTNTAGMPIIASPMASGRGLETSSVLLPCRKRASASTSAIFISSDGCRSSGPRLIQRCAPRPEWPATSTATSSSSATP